MASVSVLRVWLEGVGTDGQELGGESLQEGAKVWSVLSPLLQLRLGTSQATPPSVSFTDASLCLLSESTKGTRLDL